MLALPPTTGVSQIQYVTVEVEEKATPKADAESQVGLATTVNEITIGGELAGAVYIEKEVDKEVGKFSGEDRVGFPAVSISRRMMSRR